MAIRNKLHVKDLDAFRVWLGENHYQVREPRGDYQVMQIWYQNNWHTIYYRDATNNGGPLVHLTVPNALETVVRAFVHRYRPKEKR